MTCTNGRFGLALLNTALPVMVKRGCSVPLNWKYAHFCKSNRANRKSD